ncbi:MAG TPA: AMP-binding protein [Gammaproteobacteria bacterium]|nr:AMP-binding protein [Gammaproteobacteria bacterium]
MTDSPWLAQYPQGVPSEIDVERCSSLVELFVRRATELSAEPAFTNEGTTLSFRDVERLSAAFAGFLQSVPGLSKADRVAIMLPNLLQSPIAIIGTLRAGMVVVNVNPQYTPRELRHQLRDSGAKAIVVLENFADTLAQIVADTDIERIIVCSVGDQHPMPKRWLFNFVVRYVKKLVKPAKLGATIGWRDALRAGSRQTWRDLELRHEDVAILQYTGGTTGVAKGAVLTHRNLLANVLQMTSWAGPFFDRTAGAVITPLPLYHVFALTVGLFGFLELGGHNVLITDPRDIRRFVATLRRQPFVFMIGVNTLFNALLHNEAFAKLDFAGFRSTLAGGMAVQRDVADRWRQLTGCVIAQGYGLTEASPVVSANRLDTREFNGSIGLPLPSTRVRIVSDSGHEVPHGEAGEICVRGPQVMREYWRRPADTADVLDAEGWLRTGDIGRMDASGYIYIDDRKKDMIIVSGFKVFPNEVEDVVTSHPGVLEAAAIGVPDEESGERVKLVVVRKDDGLSEADVRTYCEQNLTGYKRPREIEFRAELPKSNVGKILRRVLKESA